MTLISTLAIPLNLTAHALQATKIGTPAVSIEIRSARNADLDAILVIHNRAIRESTAIWSEVEVNRADRARWLDAHRLAGHPVIVAIVDGVFAGYASYGKWREKTGYRFTVENSVYVSGDFQRRGIGRMLMVELIGMARASGIHVMIAAIEAGNSGSIALHEELGFEPPVIVREVGYKFDRWLDLALMRLVL